MRSGWWNLAPSAVRIAKKLFFFYKSSYSVNFPSDPIRRMIRYRHPLARALVGWLPYAAKRPFLHLRVTERIVDPDFRFGCGTVSPGPVAAP